MGRVRFIEHGGKKLLLQDFSNITDSAVALRQIAEARDFIELQTKGTVLLVTTVEGSQFDQGVVEALRELAMHHKPWVKAAAITGLSPIQRVVYLAVIKLTGRSIQVCKTLEDAKDWLVSQT